jgi:DNA-binding SARP family transcriptional activator/predicted ATPase
MADGQRADAVAVRLLGPVRLVTTTGAEMGFRGHAARLLAWLALHPDRVWAADDLATRLWPDGPPPTARTAIQGHISRLRRTLAAVGGVRIESTSGGYVLRARPGAVDALRFTSLCEAATAAERRGRGPAAAATLLAAALDLWSGDALADLRDDPHLGPEGRALEDQRLDAEERHAHALIEAGDIDRALALLAGLVNAEPLRERRWALLMTALARAGRQADALRAYRRAAETLVERTGLDPGPELQRLETAILLQDPVLDVARWQPAPGTAPAPLTGLVGRDGERAALIRRLAGSRLVTVVGPGGVGKTTLAVDVGADQQATFADGVVVVDLAPAGEGDVGAVVASAVGARAESPAPPGAGQDAGPGAPSSPDDPLARAVAALARRHVLVVLDNCEHVAAAAARTALALLQAAPGVRVLATSQVPLGVAGEAVVALGPLAVPAERAPAAAVRSSPAGELFGRRIEELGSPVAGDEDWGHVGTIVRALDGLPLAIEIVAAEARVEPLAALAARLASDASPVLVAEPPVGAGRRRLGAALDAAVARLDAPARELYALASVFPAGFDASAAAAVAGVGINDARALVARLADAGLFVLDEPRRTRVRLLQPVRAHAAARLDPEQEDAARGRLATWCLALAEGLDQNLHSPAEDEIIDRFMVELPLFRSVLRRLLDTGHTAAAADLFRGLAACWADSPASPEAPEWADELVARADELGPGPRARLEIAAVHVQFAFELIAGKLPVATRALASAEAAGDEFTAAAARLQMAVGLGWRGVDMDRAAALLDRARTAFTDLGERHWAAVTLEFQGLLALRRLDVVAGIAVLESAAAEHRAIGGPGQIAHTLMFIGYARRAIGDLTGALRAFDEARRLVSGTRVSTWLRATVGAGHAALALGDTAAAGDAFRLAHGRAVEVGDRRIAGTALVGLATLARRDGDDQRCIALLQAAAAEGLGGGDPTDAVTAAGMLAEMLVEQDATEEAAVLLGAAATVPDEVGVRVDFGLAYDGGPVRHAVAERLGEARLADLAGDGRAIGLAAQVRRAAARLQDAGPRDWAAPLRLVEGGVEIRIGAVGQRPRAGGTAGRRR